MKSDLEYYGADVHGVRQMTIYGLKGMSTYARHARLLGEWDDSIGAFTHEVNWGCYGYLHVALSIWLAYTLRIAAPVN